VCPPLQVPVSLLRNMYRWRGRPSTKTSGPGWKPIRSYSRRAGRPSLFSSRKVSSDTVAGDGKCSIAFASRQRPTPRPRPEERTASHLIQRCIGVPPIKIPPNTRESPIKSKRTQNAARRLIFLTRISSKPGIRPTRARPRVLIRAMILHLHQWPVLRSYRFLSSTCAAKWRESQPIRRRAPHPRILDQDPREPNLPRHTLGHGFRLTRRWKEPDSNLRSPETSAGGLGR
jgi:hypothetical protein